MSGIPRTFCYQGERVLTIFICVLFGCKDRYWCLVVGMTHLPREEGLLDLLIVNGRGYDFVCT